MPKQMDVREQLAAGYDVRPRPLARAVGLSDSGMYGLIAKGKIRSRRVGDAVVIPNEEGRRVAGMAPGPEASAIAA
ncbi:hypothetical protein MKK63_24045 [Methylobacterium sp. J-088]|uniref:hypothetical protein n=1 Tax=Methylobacterium sp. J-088 TaxID=2836664 RepID=UPI001FB8B62E|nr:hypothetical protein [Methylobacterium sp. J-088]MCJ2065751.1 hypothetical protein [Methylobacterium sp. J-088]